MKIISSVRSRSAGFWSRRRGRLAVLAVCALAPLGSMAVVIPSAVAVRMAETERRATLRRLDERDQLERTVGGYRDEEAIRKVVMLNEALDGLVPRKLRPLDEFGEIRSVAAGLGVHLRSVRLVRTHRASGGPGDDPDGVGQPSDVAIDEVLVTADVGLEDCVLLIDELRSHGTPIVVLGFDLSRSRPGQPTFQSELRLGFLRRSTKR